MRITIEQAQLLKSLQIVEHAVNERSTLPILANILLETHENTLTLTATDLDLGVRYQLPLLTTQEQGAITLPARRFTSIIRELPEDPITIEAKKNHTASVSCRTSLFKIQGLPPEDFPLFPPITETHPTTLPQEILKTLITQTAFAMSPEETRFVLNGALLQVTANATRLVATDGRRLALATAQGAGASNANLSAIIPAKTVRELSRLLQPEEDGDAVTIAQLKDNQLVFRFSGINLITRLVEGQFPNYENVIPPPAKTTVTCSQQLLASAIRRVSLMTTATSQAVVFELERERLTISKESPELGSAREELPATYTGQPMRVAFNPEFWLDVLKAIEVDPLTIEVVGEDKPAVIRLPQLLYLVLPMKLA